MGMNSTEDSDTPRTDSLEKAYRDHSWPSTPVGIWHLVKEMERENARLREALEHIRDNGMTMIKEAIAKTASDALSNTERSGGTSDAAPGSTL